ncbi:MAG: phosphotransferase [Firmicutes bacterium]|nr:phosphotransferase [Bacillota bacterium]
MDLGNIVGDILPVSGGLMHRMFRVETDKGVYAVKCLNPEIMKRPGVLENYAKAERLEKLLEEKGLSVVPALSFAGKKMQEEGGQYFYVYKWQEGSITDWNAITKEQCYIAGEIQGKIHAIDARVVEPEAPELCEIDFRAYLKTAKEQGSPIAELLEESIDLLEAAVIKLNDARKSLPLVMAVIDDDMDPKNVMWHEGKPYVIDLECLDYGNPIASSLNLALQWAGTVNERYSEENLIAFFDGYLSAYDNSFRGYDSLFGIAYSWVEWLEYNVRRALGMEGNVSAEISLGEQEVKNTINRIRYLGSIEKEVCAVLKNKIASVIDFSAVTACGECCVGCGKKLSGECPGCIEADGKVPEWAGSGRCKIHACASDHGVQFCGLCEKFPCENIPKIIHWNPNIVNHLTKLRDTYRNRLT